LREWEESDPQIQYKAEERSTHQKLTPDPCVDAVIRDETFFLSDVEGRSMGDSGLVSRSPTEESGWGPGVLEREVRGN
jgi:hypothetical protein